MTVFEGESERISRSPELTETKNLFIISFLCCNRLETFQKCVACSLKINSR
jgi:hypothetical protein